MSKLVAGVMGVLATMSLTLVPNANAQPSGSNTFPTQGSHKGRGITSGAVFGKGQMTDASLSFNSGRFNLSLSVSPGTSAQITYMGTFTRLQPSDVRGSQNFILQGRVQSVASSANNLKVVNTSGTCEIEVFVTLVVSSTCNTSAPRSSTRFQGLEQF